LGHQNNFVKNNKALKIMSKNFNILATSLSVLHNYFDEFNKNSFLIQIQLKF